jgi:hypothetical protein
MPTELFEANKISADSLTGAVWRVKVIEGDRKGSSAYYPKEVVEAGKDLFAKGTRVYGDHPTSDEKWARPERSYKDIVGVFESDSEYDGKDLYANVRFFTKHQQDIKEMAEAGVIGMSIRAAGDVEETADGPVLKAFTSVTSVDVVTTAGAGGGFDKLLESAKVSASESGAESLEEKESIMDPKLEAALDALVESAKATATAVAALTERATKEDADKAAALTEAARLEAEAKAPKAPTAAEIAGALVEAELPKAAHAKVIAAVESGTALAEAITAEKDYLKTVIEESGKEFKGNGSEELQEAAGSKIGVTMFGEIS